MSYILIVDDDEDFSAAVATALRHAGHETKVLHETGGVPAEVERRRPDLLVLDVMFPEDKTAGFTLARTLRAKEREAGRPPIPAVMLTAVNEKFPLGFNPKDIDEDWLPVAAFLEKPIDLDALAAKVAELLPR